MCRGGVVVILIILLQAANEAALWMHLNARIHDEKLGTVVKTKDGHIIPYHLLPSATSIDLPDGKDLSTFSCIFRVSYDDLLKMNRAQVRKIFRHRHIWVTGIPHEERRWNEEGMADLGPLDEFIPIQGECLSTIFLYS